MNATTEKDYMALAAEMKQLRSDFVKISDLLQTLIRDAGDDVVKQARETGERAWEQTRAKTEDILQVIENRPVASTAAAFGIGMLFGMLVHGRR